MDIYIYFQYRKQLIKIITIIKPKIYRLSTRKCLYSRYKMDEKTDENKEQESSSGTKIVQRVIEDEMKQSYLDYSMSVIVGRALPDARDGLKPVHRRILFGMYKAGLSHNKPYRKSAFIVGRVMSEMHPHGDASIYDSLVRMAQDFSLRNLLIDGQGNFGCFTEDTKVKLTDGRDLSFKDLIKEHKQGKKNYTYTINSKGIIEIAEIKKPRLTKKKQKIMKVVLDNGEDIRCTLDHKFMLRDGTYNKAQNLNAGDSLMPINLKLSTKKDNIKPELVDYQMIYQPNMNEWISSHILSDNWNLKQGIYTKSSGRVRHHMDFNKLNNNPDNVARLHWKDHWKLHAEHASQLHKNPEYRKKITEGREKFWSKEENRIKYSQKLSQKNKKNWEDKEYRERMSLFLSEINKKHRKKNPQLKEFYSKLASNTLKRLWKDPKYKQLFHEKIVASNKRRVTNNTGKVKFLKVCREVFKQSGTLSKDTFEKTRKIVYPYGHSTSWELGLKKYFSRNKNLLLLELHNNHKVSHIEFLTEKQDVYDITIDDTHNFALAAGVFVHNSIDGDNAAAMRYSEARLKKLAEEMLQDIEKRTVKFVPNFDNSSQEPTVLPSKVPNLLINGSSGIAVGMATNIPPHNILEIIDGIIKQIDNPEITVEELMQHIKGPDFPTGAIIYGKSGIKSAYKTGKGKVILRAKAEVEEIKDKKRILITEIPYMVNKSEMISQIADSVRDKKINGISDIRDESDRHGIRILIELKKDTNTDVLLNQLYMHSRLQVTFGITMLALVNNVPKILNLKQLIQPYIDHRKDIVRKRTFFDLHKAQNRAHLLEGLIIALDNLDKTIKLIKESKSVEEAKNSLITNFDLTNEQSTAILEMRLQRLTSLEQEKVKKEHSDLLKLIEKLKAILQSPQKILDIIKSELIELKENYADNRRTEIIDSEATSFEMEDIIQKHDCVITITHSGYIKRQPLQTYRQQRRGGKGLIATTTREEDFVRNIFIASTHSYILFFTNKGKVHWQKVYHIPEASRQAKGKAIVNLIHLQQDEKITAYIPIKTFDSNHFLVMATKKGTTKKTNLTAYSNPRKGGIIAISLDKNDSLIGVKLTDGSKEIILATRNGIAVRFNENNIRPTGRSSQGVRGIRLSDNDYVIGMVVATDEKTLLTVTENGYGKRTIISEYRLISRGGSGVKNIICSERNGKVVAVNSVSNEDEIMLISRRGITIRTPVSQISVIGRNTQGVKLISLAENDKLVGVAKIIKTD